MTLDERVEVTIGKLVMENMKLGVINSEFQKKNKQLEVQILEFKKTDDKFNEK